MKRLIAAAALAFGLSTAQAEETPVVITVAGPMTGASAGNGADMAAGARAAATKINGDGGVLQGRPIVIRLEDDAGEPQQGISVAGRVAGSDSHYVVGHFQSTVTMPASAVYDENGIVQITLSQSPAILQQNYPALFRITPNAAELSKHYMETIEAATNRENPRIALIGTNDEYSRSIAENILKQLENRSIKPAMIDYFTPRENDYSSLIVKMKAAGINIVLVAGSDYEMGLIVRQSPDLGFEPYFILSSTAASAGFAGIASCNAGNVKVVAAWNPLYTPGHEDLFDALHAEGADGIDTAINAYSAVMAIAQGIDQAGRDDPAAVAKALHSGTFALPIGDIQFTANGELAQPRAIVYEYQKVGMPCTHIEMRPATP